MRLPMPIFILVVILPFSSMAQVNNSDTSIPYSTTKYLESTNSLSDKSLSIIKDKYNTMTLDVNKQATTLLSHLQRNEAKLKKKVQDKDSAKATQVFDNSESEYQKLKNKLLVPTKNPVNSLRHYVPGIDSMQTAIQFFGKVGLPVDKIQKLQSISEQLKQLQASLQNANDIQDYITQREAQLGAQLDQLGLGKQLLGMNKDVFYYQQQLQQYKTIINDQEKQQQLLLATIRQLPAFQDFWQRNSMLAQLFPQPGNGGTLLSGAGLQAISQVGSLIQQRLGAAIDDGGANASQYLQQQVSNGQGQMESLKQKLDNLHMSGGSSDMTLPEFTPNEQKKKTFLQRLEYGVNLQNSGGTTLLPTISTLGLSLGYKLNDKATVGIGISYLLGLGKGIDHIALTNQGVGFRSYVDIKAKGGLWITGGYECNYMQQFSKLSDIKNLDIWQKSALLGLTKKYKVGKKDGNTQLLYDFLADSEIPRGQAFKIRFGYSF